MATVRTQRGDRFMVDLGPADEARRLDLGEGDELTVRGIRIRLGDRNLVFATDARANDENLSFQYGDASDRSEERVSSDSERRSRDRQSSDGYSSQNSDRSDRQQNSSQSGRGSRSESGESSSSNQSSQASSRSDRDRDSSETQSR